MTTFRQFAKSIARDDVIATATLDPKADGTSDGLVQVWAIESQTLREEFDTVLDFGGRRLALCAESDRIIVVAGAWARHGICGYDAQTGERLWQRNDLKNAQALSPVNGDAVAACFDRRSMHVLGATGGDTIAKVRGIRRFWQSPHQAVGAAEMLGQVALVGTDDWEVHWRTPVAGFALLDAAFAPDAVLVSNTIDPAVDVCSTSCFSLTGERLWQRDLPRETNVPWLGWDADAGEWLGISHDVEKSEPEMLLRWSREGELLSRIPVGIDGEYAILPSGRRLVTGSGEVFDTRATRPVGRLLPRGRVSRRGAPGARFPRSGRSR